MAKDKTITFKSFVGLFPYGTARVHIPAELSKKLQLENKDEVVVTIKKTGRRMHVTAL